MLSCYSLLVVYWCDYYEFAVVYLDADTIVVKNIDDLFKCRKFCANLKHSERLNSGVMVVEPSETVFNDMVNKIKTTKSYTGGKTFFGASMSILDSIRLFLWIYLDELKCRVARCEFEPDSFLTVVFICFSPFDRRSGISQFLLLWISQCTSFWPKLVRRGVESQTSSWNGETVDTL